MTPLALALALALNPPPVGPSAEVRAAAVERIQKKLAQPSLLERKLKAYTLGDLIIRLERTTGVRVVIVDEAVKAEGVVDPLALRPTSAEKVERKSWEAVLTAATKDMRIAYIIRPDCVEITSQKAAGGKN